MPPEASQDAALRGADALRIGGLTRLTGIDFPGRLAAVVFLLGCPWRCVYCHNPALLDAAVPGALAWPAVRAFLQQRRGLLDSGVALECHTTWHAGLFGRDELFWLANELVALSVRHWVLQTCRSPASAGGGLEAGDLATLASCFVHFECR